MDNFTVNFNKLKFGLLHVLLAAGSVVGEGKSLGTTPENSPLVAQGYCEQGAAANLSNVLFLVQQQYILNGLLFHLDLQIKLCIRKNLLSRS